MFTRALDGLRYIWSREPLRLLYIAGLLASAAYTQLSSGLSLQDAAFALGALLLTELGRAVVTSPATAATIGAD